MAQLIHSLKTFTRWYHEQERALAYMREFREERDGWLMPLHPAAIAISLGKTPKAVERYLFKNYKRIELTYKVDTYSPRGRHPRLSYAESMIVCRNILQDVLNRRRRSA